MEAKQFKFLHDALSKYENAVSKAEQMLVDKIEFEFFVQHQPSDGITIVNSETNYVAPFQMCLDIIKRKGTLSEEDFQRICV